MHYPHHSARSKNAPHASSSSSLSSAASSDLLSTATPSNSSQSDIATDLSPSAPSAKAFVNATPSSKAGSLPSKVHRFFPLGLAHRSVSAATSLSTPNPSTTSSAHAGPMGQTLAPASIPQSLPLRSSSPGPGAGGRFKRAWNTRRKKSEDVTAILTGAGTPFKGKERASNDGFSSQSDLSHTLSQVPSNLPDCRTAKAAPRHIGKLNVFSGSKAKNIGGQSLKGLKYSGDAPPPPPPKETPGPVSPPSLARPQQPLRRRGSDLPPVPVPKDGSAVSSPLPSPAIASEKMKEDWRKSDSTMMSHNTIRPGALAGNRSPRPVSLAESNHSGNTVVPAVNKRFSALLTDAEFTMMEESDSVDSSGSDEEEEGEALSVGEGQPPAAAPKERPMERDVQPLSLVDTAKTRNRRSMSLNLGPGHCSTTTNETPVAIPARSPSSLGFHATTSSGSPLAAIVSRDTPTLTRAAANGIIAPLNVPDAQHSTGSRIRTRLAPWTSPSAGFSPLVSNSALPATPTATPTSTQSHNPWRRQHPPPTMSNSPPPTAPASFRQTAVSMTGSLAPAAGFAMRLGKGAMEKVVGRSWGFSSASSNASISAASSSASSVASSDHGHGFGFGHALGRTVSKESSMFLSPAAPKPVKRRFGKGSSPSVASSMTSSSAASGSDMDGFGTMGLSLGRRIRGPRRTSTGASIIGGLLFKRDLETCVRETIIDGVRKPSVGEGKSRVIVPLEERQLPALVVRCAQHLIRWGMQEEGLFRVSGRASHVAKLRSEFDAGSDWDMTGCDPSDLDPHAVASVFKTFLRELPESILTTNLMPYFESALATEEQASRPSGESPANGSVKSAAPKHHRSGSELALRKAPSLSTLAMPSFASKRTVSEALLNALTWVIARLPIENRDLLYTVCELMKTTAAHSKETKMPLGNLLLVLCPTLNMNPALLRVLCEQENIWESVPEPEPEPTPEQEQEDGAAEDDAADEEAEEDIRATYVTAPEIKLGAEDASEGSMHDLAAAPSNDPTEDDDSDSEIIEVHDVVTKSKESSYEAEDELVEAQVEAENRIARIDMDHVLPPIDPISPVALQGDSESVMSTYEPFAMPTRSQSPSPRVPGAYVSVHGDLPPLSTSTESLTSPSEMSEEPPSPEGGRHFADTDKEGEASAVVNLKQTSPQTQELLSVPHVVEHSESPLPTTPRRPTVHMDTSVSTTVDPAPALNPSVPFPSSSNGSSPNTPISRRKSFVLLSFPQLRSAATTAIATPQVSVSSPVSPSSPIPPSSWHRAKRPSLHLLFSKISGVGNRRPSNASAESNLAMASTPAFATYAPTSSASASVPDLSPLIIERESSVSPLPPKLETTISSSPIELGFEDVPDSVKEAPSIDVRIETDPEDRGSETEPSSDSSLPSPESPLEQPIRRNSRRSRTESCAASVYLTPMWTTPQTPIADLYLQHGRSKSALSFFSNNIDTKLGALNTRTKSQQSEPQDNNESNIWPISRTISDSSFMSITPSIDVPVDETQDDWAQSVILAAQKSDEESVES